MTAVHTDDLDLLERLGGSRATVHRAVVRTSGRIVVAKHAPWDRPDVVAGLGREAMVLGRTTHPAIVRLLHAIDDDRGRTLVLAHAPGGSLADRLARHGPVPPAEVADLGARIAEGLATLHRQGVVHRDVHPGNIVVDAELQPLLVDLDHALDDEGEHLPVDDEVVGHPDHVDPRLFSGHPPNPATDLHALATTLWTLATGAPPARPSPRQRVQLRPDGRVPPRLHDALLACLGAEDANTIAATLHAAALDLATVAHPVTSPGDAMPPPASLRPATAPRHSPPDALPAQPQIGDLPPPPSPGQLSVSLPPPSPAAAARREPAPVGMGPGAGRSGVGETRRWGAAPRPTPLATIAPVRGRRLATMVAIVLAGAVLLTAPLLLWLTRSGDTAATPVGAPVAAPAPCTGLAASTPDHVLADLDGDGCSEPLRLSGGVLTTATGAYRLGRDGDVLVAGDWDGDGRWSPGLYRPSTGEAFLFDTAPGEEAATSRAALQLPVGGHPLVVDDDGDGRHELVVSPGRD